MFKRLVQSVLVCSIVGLFIVWRWIELPFPAAELASHTVASPEYWTRDGVLLRASLSAQGSRCLWRRLGEIAPIVRVAFVANEDRRFEHHDGIDIRALGRAIRDNTLGRTRSGASTISMQLARLLRPHRPGVFGKAQEALLAVRLERSLSKDEIFEQYINRIALGRGVVGVEAASWLYFGRHANQLEARHAAMLAGLARAPSKLDPRFAPSSACAAAQRALLRMGADAYCPEVRDVHWPNEAPHFVNSLPRAPQRYETTIDSATQRLALEVLRRHRQRLLAFGVENAALVVVDNQSGELRAVVGSMGEGSQSEYVDASKAARQAGSILKPFLYATLLDAGARPDALLPDFQRGFRQGESLIVPSDADGLYRGLVPLRLALGSSLNVPAVSSLEMLGVQRFGQKLDDLGLRSRTAMNVLGLGMALGVDEVSLLAVTTAFSLFRRGGVAVRTKGIRGDATSHRAFAQSSADRISEILADDSARRLGFLDTVPIGLRGGVMLKTGTSTLSRDYWALASNGRWTCGAWAGNADGSTSQDSFAMVVVAPVVSDIVVQLGD